MERKLGEIMKRNRYGEFRMHTQWRKAARTCKLTIAWHPLASHSLTNHSPPLPHLIWGKWHRSSDAGKGPNHTNPSKIPVRYHYSSLCVWDSKSSVFSKNLRSHTERRWDELGVCQVPAQRAVPRRLTLRSSLAPVASVGGKRMCPWVKDVWLSPILGGHDGPAHTLAGPCVDTYTYTPEVKDGNHNSACSDTASLTDLGK